MSLLKKQPEFETMDETVGADQNTANAEAAQTSKADAPAASASTAVVEQSTLSRALDQLQAEGLIRRETDATDSRAVRVSITDTGRALIRRQGN